MKYKCFDCGKEFSKPLKYREYCGLDTPPYLIINVCPSCVSDNIAYSIGECSVCDKAIYNGERYYKLNKTGEIICDECITERN